MHASRTEKLGVIEEGDASAINGVLSPVSSHCFEMPFHVSISQDARFCVPLASILAGVFELGS